MCIRDRDYATKAMVYVPRKNKETYSSILSDAAFIYYKYGLYDKMITPLKISHNIDKSMLVNMRVSNKKWGRK